MLCILHADSIVSEDKDVNWGETLVVIGIGRNL